MYIPVEEAKVILNVSYSELKHTKKYNRFFKLSDGLYPAMFDLHSYIMEKDKIDIIVERSKLFLEYIIWQREDITYLSISKDINCSKQTLEKHTYRYKISKNILMQYPDLLKEFNEYYNFEDGWLERKMV
jgi:hypothetical protein